MPSLALPVALLALLGVARPAAGEKPARIAVLPVVVHAMEGHEYLRAGLADMMASRIGAAPGVSVLLVEDVAKATTSVEQARATAAAVGADFVVYGSFTRFGEGASLDMHCAAIGDGDVPREIFIQSGTLGEIIPKLDSMAEKITRFALSGGTGEQRGEQPGAEAAASNGADPERAARTEAELEELRLRVDEIERAVFQEEELVDELAEIDVAPVDPDDEPGS